MPKRGSTVARVVGWPHRQQFGPPFCSCNDLKKSMAALLQTGALRGLSATGVRFGSLSVMNLIWVRFWRFKRTPAISYVSAAATPATWPCSPQRICSPSTWPAQSLSGPSSTLMAKNDRRPHASGGSWATACEYGQGAPLRGKDPRRSPVPAGSGQGEDTVPHARWSKRLGWAKGRAKRQLPEWALDARKRAGAQKHARENSGTQIVSQNEGLTRERAAFHLLRLVTRERLHGSR